MSDRDQPAVTNGQPASTETHAEKPDPGRIKVIVTLCAAAGSGLILVGLMLA